MKIGIIGSGRMGGSLGKLWAEAGHEVMFSSRHPEKLKRLVEDVGHGAKADSVSSTVAFAEVLLLAPNFSSLTEALNNTGPISDKIVIDLTNPVSWDESKHQLFRVLPDHVTAASELKKSLPEARIVKAYSSLHYTHLIEDAKLPESERIAVFYCGDDPQAKGVVARLIEDSGFAPLDIGGLDQAGLQEIPGPLSSKSFTLHEAKRLVEEWRRDAAAA